MKKNHRKYLRQKVNNIVVGRNMWSIEDDLLNNPEAVSQTCSVKKAFLEISQNSQENTCGRVSF